MSETHTHTHTRTHTHTHTLRGRGSAGEKGQATRTKVADRGRGRLRAGKDTTKTESLAHIARAFDGTKGTVLRCANRLPARRCRPAAARACVKTAACCVLRACGGAVNLARARPQQEPPLLPHRVSCCPHAPHRSCAAPPPPQQRVSAPAPPGIFCLGPVRRRPRVCQPTASGQRTTLHPKPYTRKPKP